MRVVKKEMHGVGVRLLKLSADNDFSAVTRSSAFPVVAAANASASNSFFHETALTYIDSARSTGVNSSPKKINPA